MSENAVLKSQMAQMVERFKTLELRMDRMEKEQESGGHSTQEAVDEEPAHLDLGGLDGGMCELDGLEDLDGLENNDVTEIDFGEF